MICDFETDGFHIKCTESITNRPVIWESHCHTRFEMIAVSDGDITVMLEGQSYRLKKDDIIIIPPLSYHSITANSEGVYKRITALFDISAVPDVLRWDFILKPFLFSFCVEKLGDVLHRENTLYYAPLVKSLMTEIFYEAEKESNDSHDIVTDEFLKASLKYIDEHLTEKLRLDDIARHTARSKSSFCHLFFEKMNVSPKQYILKKRLALAKKLIDEGMTHTAAAMHVGYYNYSNFYRLYKKNYGND